MTTTGTATSSLAARVLNEGYGPGAWHGADLKAALADVTPEIAFRRPAAGRHNIAEIALHHAYAVHAVRGRISASVGPFLIEGEDWFELNDERKLRWSRILETVEDEHRGLSELALEDCFDLVLGVTCHAVYHAGQIQLIKRLLGG